MEKLKPFSKRFSITKTCTNEQTNQLMKKCIILLSFINLFGKFCVKSHSKILHFFTNIGYRSFTLVIIGIVRSPKDRSDVGVTKQMCSLCL